MQVSDDLFLGGQGTTFLPQSSADPTINSGVGPMGRTAFLNLIPLTASINNIATTQHMVANTGLVLTAGTGVTAVLAGDGSGNTVYKMDCNRCVSLSSTSDLHLINFTVTGFDLYGRLTTAKRAGPNNNTVNFTKAMMSVLSVVPDTTDGTHNITVGTSDIFGMAWVMADVGYIIPKWAETLAIDAGTAVIADATTPATALTGDPRGTYLPSSASDGTKRLVIWQHLTAGVCGPTATVTGAIGVTPV